MIWFLFEYLSCSNISLKVKSLPQSKAIEKGTSQVCRSCNKYNKKVLRGTTFSVFKGIFTIELSIHNRTYPCHIYLLTAEPQLSCSDLREGKGHFAPTPLKTSHKLQASEPYAHGKINLGLSPTASPRIFELGAPDLLRLDYWSLARLNLSWISGHQLQQQASQWFFL